MSSGDIALLITAIGGSLAGIITAIAALRNSNYSKDKIHDLEKENQRLSDAYEKEHAHSRAQDEIIFDQHRKLERWGQWGDSIGRQMNQMDLRIGAQRVAQEHAQTHSPMDDTQPLKPIPPDKDWITGPLGPLVIKDDD